MSTEEENLKESVRRQRGIDQLEELSAYIEKLSKNFDYRYDRHTVSSVIYVIVWLFWVLVGFVVPDLNYMFAMFFICALIYDGICYALFRQASGAFFAAMEVLSIMGFMPPLDEIRGRRKKRSWSEMADTVKGWFAKKKEVQEEMYRPA